MRGFVGVKHDEVRKCQKEMQRGSTKREIGRGGNERWETEEEEQQIRDNEVFAGRVIKPGKEKRHKIRGTGQTRG